MSDIDLRSKQGVEERLARCLGLFRLFRIFGFKTFLLDCRIQSGEENKVLDVLVLGGDRNRWSGKRLTEFVSAQSLCVWVQAEEDSFVDERVLFLCPRTFLYLLPCGAYNRLDLIAVDQASNIRVGDLRGGETVEKLAITTSSSSMSYR